MAGREILLWGSVPVPYTASWTAEERHYLAPCPYAGRLALSQDEARGEGKPLFGKPHSNRQREAIALGLCDLCAKPLKIATKVSLSHARPIGHSAGGWEILQVEPLLHRACAAISLDNCPSLKRDIADGSLIIRQVTSHRAQYAIMDEIYTEQITGQAVRSVGHAKVELRNWIDRDVDWLNAGRPRAGLQEE